MSSFHAYLSSPGSLVVGVIASAILAFAVKYSFDLNRDNLDKLSTASSENELDALYSGANDVIVVKQDDGSLKSSPLHVFVGKFENWETLIQSRHNKEAEIHINGQRIPGIDIEIGESGIAYLTKVEKTCRFTGKQLEKMNLKNGINKASISIPDLNVKIPFSVFLYNQDTKLILTDIDGTITTSDFRGVVGAHLGLDVHHIGVVEFLHKVAKNGYIIIYLTARPLALDLQTRKYLFDDLENEFHGYRLPRHPLFLTPAVMAEAVLSDATDHTAAKTKTLKHLMNLFENKSKIVHGAYGNKDSDTEAYLNIGIPSDNIFIINKNSNMINVGTKQDTSYKQHANNVHTLYPII